METILNAPAFIINLESEDDRLLYSTENIKSAGFTDIRRFDAIRGTNENQVKNALDLLNNPEIHDEIGTPGKLGCLLSHLTLLKHIIDQNLEKATIFEDDVFFHPQWHDLASEYYNETPSDYDIIFIGNSVDSIRLGTECNDKILTDSCFSAHCYTVTLEGAKRLLDACLNWRYDIFNEMFSGKNIKGLYPVDIIYKLTEIIINMKIIEQQFTWYCWNGTKYPCNSNKIPLKGNDDRNSGLVFQATDDFETLIHF